MYASYAAYSRAFRRRRMRFRRTLFSEVSFPAGSSMAEVVSMPPSNRCWLNAARTANSSCVEGLLMLAASSAAIKATKF